MADGVSWGKGMELVKGMLNWDTGADFNMGVGSAGAAGMDAGISCVIGPEGITRGGRSGDGTGFAEGVGVTGVGSQFVPSKCGNSWLGETLSCSCSKST